MAQITLLLAFLAAVAILTITPGLDTALVLRAAAVEGKPAAARAALGIALGCLAWGAAAALGLGAVLGASKIAYTVVKLAGAAYLLWLGIKVLWKPRGSLDSGAGSTRANTATNAFLRGFLTNLLNPKVGVFYVTFLPQFVPPGTNVAAYSFGLACVHVVLGLAWFAALIAATARFGAILRRPRTIATLDRLTGAIFVGFGVKLAASSAR